MGGDRLGDLRGTYQVRAHQIVTAPPTAFAGLAVLRGFGFDVFEPNPVRRRKIPESGWSQRHFRRRFAAEVGLPPKDYGSLLRFSAALTAMTTRPWHDPSALAAEFGYYDQSHLTRDFHRFAGTSPAAYSAEAGELGSTSSRA